MIHTFPEILHCCLIPLANCFSRVMKKIDPNSKNVAVRQTGWVQDWRKNDKRNIDLDLNFHGHLSISLLIYIPVNKGGVFSADYSFIMTIYTVSNNSFFKA